MTDAFTLDPGPVEDDPTLGFTDHELLALIDFERTPSGLRVLGLIDMTHYLDDPDAVRAGQSSLVVRGLASIDSDGMISPQAEAESLMAIMDAADDIVSLALTQDGELISHAIMLDSPEGAALIETSPYGVNTAQPMTEIPLLTLAAEVINDFTADADMDAIVTRHPVAEPDRRVGVRVTEAGWAVDDGEPAQREVAWASVKTRLGQSDGVAARQPRRAH